MEKVSASSAITFSKNNPSVVRIEAPITPYRDVKMSWLERGGAGRRHDVLMELELKKVSSLESGIFFILFFVGSISARGLSRTYGRSVAASALNQGFGIA